MTAVVRSDSLPRIAANAPVGPAHTVKLLKAARAAAWALVLLSAIWLLARRWYGAFSAPLDASQLILLAFLLVAVAWFLNPPMHDAARFGRVMYLPLLAVGAVGLAVSLPGSAPLTLAAFWTVLVLGIFTFPAWHYFQRIGEESARESREPTENSVGDQTAADTTVSRLLDNRDEEACGGITLGGEDELDDELDSVGAEVTQQITRARHDDGSDAMYGVLRASFAAGEQLASVNIGFCPPFPCRPQIEASWSEGPESTVQTAQVLPYGARLDVWLASKPAVATSVLVEFHAFTDRQQ